VTPGEEQDDAISAAQAEQQRRIMFDELYHCVLHRFPTRLFGPVLGSWSGMLDTTPDANPIVGPYPGDGRAPCSLRPSGYGMMRDMALDEAAALDALGREGRVNIAPYAPSRFGVPDAPFRVDWAGYNPFNSLAEIA
jgi:glycine/D-amino acid oxidase-like deaminating enzyme